MNIQYSDKNKTKPRGKIGPRTDLITRGELQKVTKKGGGSIFRHLIIFNVPVATAGFMYTMLSLISLYTNPIRNSRHDLREGCPGTFTFFSTLLMDMLALIGSI